MRIAVLKASARRTEPLSEVELEAYEAQRDFGVELLQSIREMQAGLGCVVYPQTVETRKTSGATLDSKACFG